MISYEPLRILLIKEKLKLQDLRNAKILNPNIASIINNDTGYVNLSTIDKIMTYLSNRLNRTIKIEEILRFIPEEQQKEKE